MLISITMRCSTPAFVVLLLSATHSIAFAESNVQDEIEQLRKQIAAQQGQINELRRMLQAQSEMLAATTGRTVEL